MTLMEMFPVDDHHDYHFPTFDAWYDGYPRKTGRMKAEKSWDKLTDAEKIQAWDALADWNRKAAVEGTKFLPYPATWLNQRRWEDEEILPELPKSKNMQTLANPNLQAALAAIDARNQGELNQ